VVEELGVRNILTKVYGNRNPLNVVKAVLNGLDQLLSKKQVFELRGLPVHPDREGPKLEPVYFDDDDKRKGRKDGRKGKSGRDGGRDGGRGGRGGRRGRDVEAADSGAEADEAPSAPADKPEASETESGAQE
jgi:hypothetical protein